MITSKILELLWNNLMSHNLLLSIEGLEEPGDLFKS